MIFFRFNVSLDSSILSNMRSVKKENLFSFLGKLHFTIQKTGHLRVLFGIDAYSVKAKMASASFSVSSNIPI